MFGEPARIFLCPSQHPKEGREPFGKIRAGSATPGSLSTTAHDTDDGSEEKKPNFEDPLFDLLASLRRAGRTAYRCDPG